MHAWFVCRARGIIGDIMLPLRAVADDATIAKQGRMLAARRFKRAHGLHACTRVDVEFQGTVPCETDEN